MGDLTEHIEFVLVDRIRSGGQTTGEYSVTIKGEHIPTGLTAICGYEKSQHKNRLRVIEMIEYGLACLERTHHDREK